LTAQVGPVRLIGSPHWRATWPTRGVAPGWRGTPPCVRVTASVHRKSAARQVEAKMNAGSRGFSIMRYEGSRWCGGRGGYGESTGMRVEAIARWQVAGASEGSAEGSVSRFGLRFRGVGTAAVLAEFRIAGSGHTQALACMSTSTLGVVESIRRSRQMPSLKGARRAARR
jgi:hypothetical protein